MLSNNKVPHKNNSKKGNYRNLLKEQLNNTFKILNPNNLRVRLD